MNKIKPYRLHLIVGVVLVLVLKWGWDHRPWKELVFQGYIEGEYVQVASAESGRLEQLFVHRGESVIEGQPLFALEANPQHQAQAEAEARAVLAQQNVDRVRALMKAKVISAQEADQAESEQKAAAQNLAQIKWKLDQKTQAAHEAAYVQDTFFVKGEWVTAGRPVVSLLPPGNIKVRFFVDAATRAQIKLGQKVQIKVFGGQPRLPATIAYLSSEAEYTPPVIYSNDTRAKLTFLLEAKPESATDATLTPGQPVEVILP